jgi:type I restriction enzyme, S subunit
MSWEDTTLGELLTVKHGWAFKSQYFEEDGPYVLVTPGNFFEKGGFKLRPGKDRSYSGEFAPEYLLGEGDLIVAMTEQGPGLLGSTALIPAADRFLHNQRIGLITVKDEQRTFRNFLYYLFNTAPVRGQINGSATGTKVRHTAPERIYRVRVPVPDRPTQERIAAILSTYDDLIENNRRRIALLEQAARLLYREWFVHFRFPGYETAHFVNGLPEGWGECSFAEMAEYLNGFAFKPRHLGEHGLPIVKIPELRGGILDKTPRYEGRDVPDKYLLDDGDLVFSWSGTLAIEFWNSGSAYLNQHLFKVTPNERVSKAFLIIAIRECMPQFMGKAVGATMKHIRRSALDEVTHLMPPDDLLKELNQRLSEFYDQVQILRKQNIKLTKARDLLLPGLMDGRIPV